MTYGSKKLLLNKEKFYDEYISNCLSIGMISKKYGVSKSYLCELRDKYGIEKQQRWNTIGELSDELAKLMLELLYERTGSDEKIAKRFGSSVNLVSRLRKKYNIATELTGTGRIGELETLSNLTKSYKNVKDMNLENQYHPYDIEVNGKRIDVKTSKLKVDKRCSQPREIWEFTLSTNKLSRNKISEFRKEVKPGIYRKLFHKTCDYLIFVGLNEAMKADTFFVIPSSDIGEDLLSFAVPVKEGISKYDIYRTKDLSNLFK